MSEEDTDALLLNCTTETLLMYSQIAGPGTLWPGWENVYLSRNSTSNNNNTTRLSMNAEEIVISLLSPLLDTHDTRVPYYQRVILRNFFHHCFQGLKLRPSTLHWGQKLAWTAIFTAMLIVAVGGNTIVMWVVLAHRRMRTVTNYFLVNLSVADLLMSLLNCVFNFIYMIDSNWYFGSAYCTLNSFVANVSVAASVFTLVAISLDRYVAIVHPLHLRMSKRRARVAVACIWTASMLLALPCLLYSTTRTQMYLYGESITACFMLWPDGHYPTSMRDYVYNLIFLGVTYVVPVAAMAVCYSLMGRDLWGSRSIGERTQRQNEAIRSKRKVVRMFVIVVTIFAVCWLPYHAYFIYGYHHQEAVASPYAQHVYLAFYWLAMSNAAVNPLIYYWFNNRFRGYFQRIVCACCCLRCTSGQRRSHNNPQGPHKQTRRSAQSACLLVQPTPCVNVMHSQGGTELLRGGFSQWRRSTQETRVSRRYDSSLLEEAEINLNSCQIQNKSQQPLPSS